MRVRDRILRHLEVTGEHLTADELATVTKAAKRSVQNDLSDLVRDGCVTRAGGGTRADPYRYGAGGRSGDDLSGDRARKTGDSSPSADIYVRAGGNHPEPDKSDDEEEEF